MKFSIETMSETETSIVLTFLEANMAHSTRLDTLDTTVATLRTDLDALAATVAAQPPVIDFQPAVDDLTARVTDIETVLAIVPDEAPPA